MRRFLRAALSSQGFEVLEADCAKDALAMAAGHHPEALLLDLGLPDEDGVTLIRRLRQSSVVPIIVISARDGRSDKVDAFDAGADDYLSKPFGVEDLLAHLRAVLHRGGDEEGHLSEISIGPLRIDFTRGEVTVGGKPISLTSPEYRLLAALARKVGRVVTLRQLLAELQVDRPDAQTYEVRVHMARLRGKLEVTPARPRVLLTEPGIGYRLGSPG